MNSICRPPKLFSDIQDSLCFMLSIEPSSPSFLSSNEFIYTLQLARLSSLFESLFAVREYLFARRERLSAARGFVFARCEQRFIQAENKFTLHHTRFYSMDTRSLFHRCNTSVLSTISANILSCFCHMKITVANSVFTKKHITLYQIMF